MLQQRFNREEKISRLEISYEELCNPGEGEEAIKSLYSSIKDRSPDNIFRDLKRLTRMCRDRLNETKKNETLNIINDIWEFARLEENKEASLHDSKNRINTVTPI